MSFLEIVTRTYKRPAMLAANQRSLAAQTDDDFLQVILEDAHGMGVAAANAQLADYTPTGRYVWVLDDDDLCVHPNLVADLRFLANVEQDPPAFIMPMDHGPLGTLPPDHLWQCQPVEGGIGCSGIITRSDVWMECRAAWASGRYASDFDFIAAVWRTHGPAIVWVPVVASQVQRISLGMPETVT